MPTFKATDPDGNITEYEAATPIPEHLGAGWRLEELVTVVPVIDPDVPPEPVTMYGGRRRITKLEFVELLGDAAYAAILTMQKQSVQVEAWVKKMELTTPDADGNSVNLDDPRTQAGVMALGMMLEAEGVVAEGWAEGVLNG
jgi:hypothetical protein